MKFKAEAGLMIQDKRETNFEYEFVTGNSFCKVRGWGEIDFQKSVSAINNLVTHPDFKPHFKVMVDLKEMNYHPSYNELLRIVDILKNFKDKFKNKVALVTSQKMNVVAKLVAIYCELAGIKMKSFTNTKEATLWISEPDK